MRGPITVGGHLRIRPFNTAEGYREPRLDNDLGSVPWPVTDLRVDWHDDPVGQLAGLWQVWQPQAESYVRRALRPAEI